MFFPRNTATSAVEKLYEGEWKEGKMSGYGKMRYAYANFVYFFK